MSCLGKTEAEIRTMPLDELFRHYVFVDYLEKRESRGRPQR